MKKLHQAIQKGLRSDEYEPINEGIRVFNESIRRGESQELDHLDEEADYGLDLTDDLNRVRKCRALMFGGDLDLMGAPIHKLPPSIRVGGTLELGYTKISELPANIHVAKDLHVWETPLRKLPEHLQVGGSLNLSYSKITKLPAGLHVGGDLFIWATAVTELPADLQVGGKIYCEKGQLIRLPEKYNSKLHFG